MILQKGKSPTNQKFFLNQNEIFQTNNYKYLGCNLNSIGNFTQTKQELSKKASRVLFKLHMAFGGINPPPHIYNKLFDSLIKPVLLYNSEVWDSELYGKLKKHDQHTFFDILESEPFEKIQSFVS